MLKLIVVGLVAGIALQAFRNFPPDGPVTPNAAVLIALLGMLAAYGVGRGRRRFGSVAVASASASSESTALAAARADQRLAVQLIVNNGETGARPVGVQLPDEKTAPWLMGATDRPQLSADQVDGMDLAELMEERDREQA